MTAAINLNGREGERKRERERNMNTIRKAVTQAVHVDVHLVFPVKEGKQASTGRSVSVDRLVTQDV